ncbi:terminase small subunit [Bacillus sp. Marseille-P3661]|uniref:terminase small subunit n=1 Tax=Bacillus sp. Marseille-P3661 TaxID=1936234 RepID=UPI000C815AB0|nr:terminase small subunit [Bacillus sp. Marseille-P3661]
MNVVKGLTPKQNAFVNEYVKDFNATQAAKRAGYSSRRASEIGYQLLQKTTVIDAIRALQSDIEQQLRLHFLYDAIRAREILYEIMVNPNSLDRDKIVAAKDFLDRAGFKPTDKKELASNNSIELKFVNEI